jgi:hypothetical protein
VRKKSLDTPVSRDPSICALYGWVNKLIKAKPQSLLYLRNQIEYQREIHDAMGLILNKFICSKPRSVKRNFYAHHVPRKPNIAPYISHYTSRTEGRQANLKTWSQVHAVDACIRTGSHSRSTWTVTMGGSVLHN